MIVILKDVGYGGEPLTDDEFNALLKTYPSLSILEKFTEEEYEAYD